MDKQKVSYGVRMVSDGVRKVRDGVRKVSDGEKKVSYVVRKLSGRQQMGSEGLSTARYVHKVSPLSTDPVPLYSVYSKLQNVSKVFLDSRLGPTLSCLVAEKR